MNSRGVSTLKIRSINDYGFTLLELIIIIGMISLCIYSLISSLGVKMYSDTDFYAKLLIRDINRFHEKAYILDEKYFLEFKENGYIIKGIEDNKIKVITFGENIKFKNYSTLNCITFYENKKNINENSKIIIEEENSEDESVITIVPTSGRLRLKY